MKPSELKKDLENRLDRHVNEPRTVWTNGGRILFNHQDFVDFYSTVRNPKKGKRLASSYWVKSSNGQHVSDCYSVYVYDSTGFELCRITADNVLEFVVEPDVVWQHSQSLVSSLQNWIPILVYRHKKGFLGKVKFNLLSQNFSINFIALGGIKQKNFSHLKDLNVSGVALLSDKKKAGTYVPAFFKK